MPRKSPATSKSEKTRQRILSVAAAAYRECGVEGIGVREIMERAGLTQGGFYSHFTGKQALFREACGHAIGQTAARFVVTVDDSVQQPQSFIDLYLSAWHRDNPQEGCFVAALGSEMARADFDQRLAFGRGASETVIRLTPYMEGADASERSRRAALMVSAMAGVLTVARTLAGTPMSDGLLADARRFFLDSFARQ